MIRPLLTLISYLILAAGMIVAVVDATRSVALGALDLTDLRDGLAPLGAESGMVAGWLAADRESVTAIVLSVPVAALAAALFVIIYGLATRKRAPRHF
jgi:hypothetical protein